MKDIDADHVASHLGRAQGLTNILRATLRNSQQRMLMLPQNLLAKYNVSHEDVFRQKSHQGMKDVTFDVASCINQHVEIVGNSFSSILE